MRYRFLFVFSLVWVVSLLSCTQATHQAAMTASDEAVYASAIERADAKRAPSLGLSESVVVGVAPDVFVEDRQLSEEKTEPVVQRRFEVSNEAYVAFFAEGPAVVLGRFELEPVRDGSELLGYRITKFREPFIGVDLLSDDIIVGINDKLPQNPDQYFEQWQALKQYVQPVRLQVQRKLDRFELTWSVD